MAVTTVSKADGTLVCKHCEVADTPLKRLWGLLGRSRLEPDEGMLFRPAGSIHTFFMRFPIDVVFCDRELNVVGVERAMKPWRVAGRRRTKVVIELAAGAADRVEQGERLVLASMEA